MVNYMQGIEFSVQTKCVTDLLLAINFSVMNFDMRFFLIFLPLMLDVLRSENDRYFIF